MPLKLLEGDIIVTKKKHPCGSFEFEINRVGADFRMQCLGCGKQIWIERKNLEKRIKKVRRDNEEFKKDDLVIKDYSSNY